MEIVATQLLSPSLDRLALPRQLGRGRLDASPAPRKNSRAHTLQPSRSRPPSADPAGRVVGKKTNALVTWLVRRRESHGNLVSSGARLEEQDLLGFSLYLIFKTWFS